eukprot:UN26855
MIYDINSRAFQKFISEFRNRSKTPGKVNECKTKQWRAFDDAVSHTLYGLDKSLQPGKTLLMNPNIVVLIIDFQQTTGVQIYSSDD